MRFNVVAVLLAQVFAIIFCNSVLSESEGAAYLKMVDKKLDDWANNVLAARLVGREILKQQLPKSGMKVLYAPNRYKPIGLPRPLPGEDPLYKPSSRGEVTYEWRDYLLGANVMPYLDNHLLIIGDERQDQNLIYQEKTLRDLLDLQEYFPNRTIFFNHYAGNSQPHFHAHMTTEKFPIEEKLAPIENAMKAGEKELLREKFEFNLCQRGIFLVGNKDAFVKQLLELLKSIERISASFNLIILPMKDNRFRAVIILRPLNAKSTSFEKIPEPVINSGVTLGGLYVINKDFLRSADQASGKVVDPSVLDEAILENCRESVLSPSVIEQN